MRLDGAAAVVTGGASGLGFATAERLAADGAHVVVLDLPGSPGAAAAEKIGGTARFVAADVTDPDGVAAALDAAGGLGPLRVAVNCAGIGPAARVLGRQGVFPLDLFAKVVQVNLVGTLENVLRLAAERIAATEPVGEERGVVVNTASVAAFDGQVGQAAYAASKGGVAGMTLPVARDLAQHRIRVVTIAPGLFATPMMAGLPAEARESLGRQVPHPSRLGDPAEYAALVAHVVANPMLNGEVVRLDGAIRMAPR
ncbi:3-hydroxy-2-methylbutyryl-CoA dehydrogenase [Pseudonocardia sp. CNS-139]|nr:3-hydroxy-2-methylbutyryl-CoA dehydrogenase [Pseudonocardia sp. CNS-139]